jgi:GAF domain-containing protein
MRMRVVIAAVVSLLAGGLFAATVGSASLQGAIFVDYQPEGLCASRITGVSDELKAQGLRVGDVVQLNRMNVESRLRINYPSRAGSQTTWSIQRSGKQIDLNLNFSSVPPSYLWGMLIRLSFVVLGLVALWRGRDAASLGLGVFFCGISAILSPNYSLLNTDSTFVVIFAISLLGAASLVGLVWMAASLTSSYLPPRWVRFARVASPIIAIAHFAGSLFSQLVPIYTACDSRWAVPTQIGAFSLQMSLAMGLLGAAMHRAPPAEQARVGWIYWCTSIGFLGPLAGILISIFRLPVPAFDWYNLTILAIPFGYTYAVLRHRLIDIGFVLNRALVYGIMTTLIVGTLAIAENLLASAAIGKGASLTLELLVAGVLGLSFNALHGRINAVVDRIFFRQKHEAEAALERLTHESAFIEKPSVLLDRAADDIYRHSGAGSCAIYEREGDQYRLVRQRGTAQNPEVVDVDDPAFVRMRATLRDVDLEDVPSTLGARGLAVPMAVRGGLIGAIVLGPRKTDEPYAPDERALLLRVAHEIAAALHAMHAKDHAELVGALATGLIDVQAAQSRARQLRSLT